LIPVSDKAKRFWAHERAAAFANRYCIRGKRLR
jgi:hypothetical protein